MYHVYKIDTRLHVALEINMNPMCGKINCTSNPWEALKDQIQGHSYLKFSILEVHPGAGI